MKKLFLLTLTFGLVISCNDYEDDFANLNDKLGGISSQLDGIETAVQGIAEIQLELLNINSAISAVANSIADLPTVEDISNLSTLISTRFTAVDAYLSTIDGNLTSVQQDIADILTELGDIDIDLSTIDADNKQILLDLAAMLAFMETGFDDLSDENQKNFDEILAVQTQLATTLSQISALNTLLLTIQSTIDTNDASVDAQLAAITALIEALQDDLTVLLESTTTVYNDDLDITNDAQLEYAFSLDNKVMVINGYVNVDTNFAGTDAVKLAEIDSVMSKMNTVTGDVTIQSTADLLADKLRSVGGNYAVSGFNITDTALANVAGDATYKYTTDPYTESNLENIGGSLTITDNGSATVDFSSLETIGATSVFSIKDSGGNETNLLTDATTVKLGSAISDANINTPGLVVAYTAAVNDDILVDVSTTMTISGGQAVTGGVDITCENLTATFADVTATDVSIKSDGLNLTVANVQADDIIIIDNGATANSSLTYTSVTADMFDFTATDAGTLTIASDEDAASSWTVAETDIMSEGAVTWSHIIPAVAGTSCAVALPITGDIDISSTAGAITFDFGWMVGDLSVNAELAATVTSYQASSVDVNDWDGDSDITENWFAVEGTVDVSSDAADVIFSNKICVDNTPTYANNGQLFGNVTLSAETSVDLNTKTLYGATDISAKTDVFIGSSTPNAWLAGSLDVNGFAGTVSFSPGMQIVAPVNATGTGTFDGSNWNLSLATGYQVGGDISISAATGIDLSQADELGDGFSGAYVTTLASDGPIDLSAVASTSNDVTITGAGNVDLSALVTAAGTLSVEAADTNLDTFVSSTGDVVLASQLNGDALPVLESFVSLTVSEETVLQLVEYVSGTIELIDATTFHSSSVATSDLTADKLKNYVLFEQVVDLVITGADLPALLTVVVTTADVSPAVGVDVISITDSTTLTNISTAGNADVFVVSNNTALTTINADHEHADNAMGNKVHILDNTSLTGYTSNTSSMLEIRVEGNTSLTQLDLDSYLDGGNATTLQTAADYNGNSYVLRVTGNGITGAYAPKDNTGLNDPANLQSPELETAKTIALHLFTFAQPLTTVVAEADFVELLASSITDLEDNGDANTDFTDGINTDYEWNLLINLP